MQPPKLHIPATCLGGTGLLFYMAFSITALLLQVAKCHLTSKHRQTTSPPSSTVYHTWDFEGLCGLPVEHHPAISRCGTVLRASVHVISGCIRHPTHLNLDFQHSLLLHSHLSPSWTRAEGSEWGPTPVRAGCAGCP